MKSFLYFFIFLTTVFCESYKPIDSFEQNNEKDWIGTYYFSSKNKDGLRTSFNINIISFNNITVKYINEGDSEEVYKKLKSEFVNKDKIKINFNPKYDEMGVVYVEKIGENYLISGSPIYFINPGNGERSLKKIK